MRFKALESDSWTDIPGILSKPHILDSMALQDIYRATGYMISYRLRRAAALPTT